LFRIGWWRKEEDVAYVIISIIKLSTSRAAYSALSSYLMDALKAVVAEKRKAIEQENGSSQRPAKYLRRGDIERLKEEEKAREETERREREEAARLEAEMKAIAAKPMIVSCFNVLFALLVDSYL
jgi:hypothetical protein